MSLVPLTGKTELVAQDRMYVDNAIVCYGRVANFRFLVGTVNCCSILGDSGVNRVIMYCTVCSSMLAGSDVRRVGRSAVE